MNTLTIEGHLIDLRCYAIDDASAEKIQNLDDPYEGLAEHWYNIEDDPTVQNYGPVPVGASLGESPFTDLKQKGSTEDSSHLEDGIYVVTLMYEEGLYGEVETKDAASECTFQTRSLALWGRPDAIVTRILTSDGKDLGIDQENLCTTGESTEFGLLKMSGGETAEWILPLEELAEDLEEGLEEDLF